MQIIFKFYRSESYLFQLRLTSGFNNPQDKEVQVDAKQFDEPTRELILRLAGGEYPLRIECIGTMNGHLVNATQWQNRAPEGELHLDSDSPSPEELAQALEAACQRIYKSQLTSNWRQALLMPT